MSDFISHGFRNTEHTFPENVLYLQHVYLVIWQQYNCFPAENCGYEVTLGPITANYSLTLEFRAPSQSSLLSSHTQGPGEHSGSTWDCRSLDAARDVTFGRGRV